MDSQSVSHLPPSSALDADNSAQEGLLSVVTLRGYRHHHRPSRMRTATWRSASTTWTRTSVRGRAGAATAAPHGASRMATRVTRSPSPRPRRSQGAWGCRCRRRRFLPRLPGFLGYPSTSVANSTGLSLPPLPSCRCFPFLALRAVPLLLASCFLLLAALGLGGFNSSQDQVSIFQYFSASELRACTRPCAHACVRTRTRSGSGAGSLRAVRYVLFSL